MKFRVVIADDEQHCRRHLRSYLEGEPGVEVVAECSDGLQALNAIAAEHPDLVFLDIKMPEVEGFAVLDQLQGETTPVVILVTAFDEFAIRAFDSEAVDYLLKPFDRERFQRAFRRAVAQLDHFSATKNAATLGQFLEQVRPRQTGLRRFTVRTGSGFVLVKPEEIEWIASADNYSELHVGKTTHLVRSTLSSLARELAGHNFVQVSRSALVNQDRILRIVPKSHGDAEIELATGARVIATRTYREGWSQIISASI